MRLGEDDAWAKQQKYFNSNIMKNENSADGLEVKRDTFPPANLLGPGEAIISASDWRARDNGAETTGRWSESRP